MTYVSENFWHDAVNKATTDLFTFGYKHIIKPHFVFNQTPDVAHDQMIQFCKITKNIPPLMWACREMLNYSDPVLETSVMGVDFVNPFGLSAGLDKNCEMPVLLDNAGFGFETVGSTTSRPCPGNPKPWFHRLPEYDSMMVHVGLANEGSEIVVPRAEQAWTKARDMQISVSIARTNDDKTGDLDEGIEDYCISMRRTAGRTAMVEVNISCPNTMAGEPFNQSPEALDKLFTELDKIERPQPTLVKMPLNKSWEEFKDLLDVLAEHNVQGLSIANLQKDRAGMEIPRDWEGGLSGSPCYEASNERIKQVYREYGDRFAIAGIGGVFTPQQAYAKIRSGSSLVMFISSLMYRGPQQITVLKRGLAELLKRDDGVLRGLLRDGGTGDLEAAGEIDRFVFEIRHAVEHGSEYSLEGFGVMKPGPNATIAFVYEPRPAAESPAEEPAGRKRPTLQPEKVAEAVKTAFAEPRVSASVRGLRYGKPPKSTDAYRYVDRVPRRRADRFIWIAVIAAVLAVAAIAFGLWRDAREKQAENEYIELPQAAALPSAASQPEQPE